MWFCGVLSGSGVVFCGSWVVELGEHDEDETEDDVVFVVTDELFVDKELEIVEFNIDEPLWMQFVGYFDEANIDDGFGLCGVVSIFIGFWSNCGDDEIGACVQRWKHDFRNRLFKDY